MAAEVRLDIHADPICPWCLIGKAWLDRALEGAAHHPFVVAWHPFQLNPDMPPGGMDRRAYLEAKFGGQMAAVDALRPVVEAAEAAGVSLDLGAIARTPNTLDAHRVIHWAGLEGRQTPVMAALMRGYFQQGQDLGDRDTLAALAGQAGMDPTLVTRLLDSDADRDTIAARDAEARSRGIRAMPTFIVAGSYVLPGAQPTALWREVLAELSERGA
ncbi:MAG: DsbA family oxidoreductase [Alkalilacustris sp.]